MQKYFLVFSHRHRRTEQEEDEELISQNKHAQTSVVHFDQNPHCKWLFNFFFIISERKMNVLSCKDTIHIVLCF